MEKSLKSISLDELLKLLGERQRHLALSKLNKADPGLIRYNQKLVQLSLQAMVAKRSDNPTLK